MDAETRELAESKALEQWSWDGQVEIKSITEITD
jgi:hypothetical protein